MNVEQLNPRNVNDVWGELEAHSSPKVFLPFANKPVQVRMIGSLLVVKRMWFDFTKDTLSVDRELLVELLRGNKKLYDEAITLLYDQLSPKVRTQLNRSNPWQLLPGVGKADSIVLEKIQQTTSLFMKNKWKPAVGFNALSRGKSNGDFLSEISLGICFLSFRQMHGLLTDRKITPSSKIAGLFAHDIHGVKTQRGNRQVQLQPQQMANLQISAAAMDGLVQRGIVQNDWLSGLISFEARPDDMSPVLWTLSKEATRLDKREVDYILRSGLFDLNKSILHLNRASIHKGKGRIYTPSKSLKDSKELITSFVDELSLELAESHENAVDINAASLNSQYFAQKFDDPISRLEI